MPSFADVSRFLVGQGLGRTSVPSSIDFTSKIILITGANTGLGYDLRFNPAKVIIGCRDLSKGQNAKSKLLQEVSTAEESQIEIWQVDLSSYSSVISFGERTQALPRLDVFLANAGVELTKFTTAEGLETTITVNVVSTYLSALAVLPKLEETALINETHTTLSIAGSLIHTFGPDAQLDVPEPSTILESLSNSETADMDQRYPLSKLMAHMCGHELAHRVAARTQAGKGQVTVNVVNPGWCASELGRNKDMSLPQKAIFSIIGRTAEQGSRTLVHAIAAGPESHDMYLSECQIKLESSFMQSDRCKQLSARLWNELGTIFEKVSPVLAEMMA